MKVKKNMLIRCIFICCALLAISYFIDVSRFIDLIGQLSIPFFLLVVFVVLFDQAFMGAKWNFLLHVFHIYVPTWVPILAYLRGRIFTYVAPSSLGLDAYKFYCIRKYEKKSSLIISSIFIERSFGILSSIAIVLLLLPFSISVFGFAHNNYIVWIGISAFLLLCFFLHLIQSNAEHVLKLKFPTFFPEKAHALLKTFVKDLARLKQGRLQIWLYFVLSIFEKTSYGLAVYFSARSIGLEEPGPILIISVAPLLALLERLPISISAIGIREGMFVILFAPFYSDLTIPLTISLVLRAAELTQVVVFLITWFIGRNREIIESELQDVENEYEKVH